ncbi:MAG: hypothetical protein AABZ45_11855 [Pseudomonadota bacterium]
MQEYEYISKISDAAMDAIGQIPPLVEKMGDSKMASISNPNAFEDSYTIPCVHFGPICSPFCCLSRAITEA